MTEREQLLEVMLQQAGSTIEFLHGCLTEPDTYRYAYPEMTLRELEDIGRAVPERHLCLHSKTVAGCVGCEEGAHARAVMSRWRESLVT